MKRKCNVCGGTGRLVNRKGNFVKVTHCKYCSKPEDTVVSIDRLNQSWMKEMRNRGKR